MVLKQGKKYTCIKAPTSNFTVGKEYLAVTDYQMLDDYAVPIDMRGWGVVSFFELKDEKKPKIGELLKDLKHELEEKIAAAVVDFERMTGLQVDDIQINRRETPITNCPGFQHLPPLKQFGITVDLSCGCR